MKREKLIKRIKSWHLSHDDMAALAEVIPELRESEEERIRKIITDSVFYQYGAGVEYKDVLDYLDKLEKQKYNRMQPIYDNQESFESALDKAWKSYNESGARTVDSCEDDYTECAHAKGFREGFLFGLVKQKEQKSAEWDELQTEFRSINEAFEDGKKEVIEHPEKYGLQKPAEWSEDTIRKAVKEVGLTQHQIDWFKNNVFPPKPEWSEEDEDMLNSCISSIEEAKENRYAYRETDGDTSYDHEISWLKSLRPQYHGDVTMTEAYKMGKEAGEASHWKPSEEQMDALEAATVRYQSTGLESLYEELKKLM